MNEQGFPEDWDEERVRRLLSHYDRLTDAQQAAEDEEAAREQAGTAVIAVPDELLPAIRELLASRGSE